MKTSSPSVIGIDIAKDKFDAVHLPTNEHAIFENNNEGIKHYIASLFMKARNAAQRSDGINAPNNPVTALRFVPGFH